MEDHLVSNNLHDEYQSAYRKFYSTETALLKVQNDILQFLDQNNVIKTNNTCDVGSFCCV